MQATANLPVIWNLSLCVSSSSKLQTLNPKHRNSSPIYCMRSDGQKDFENSSSSITKESKHKDIWNLFKEAQQNIMFLNKQRVAAFEELEKLKKEKYELLDRINQLDSKENNQKDKSSLLLLRIDSMVINGVIDIEEASSIRKLIKDHEVNIFDVLQQEEYTDTEILQQLREFPNKHKRNGLHVIHICTEMAPLVSVGSLASYITELSCALQEKGFFVEVILPKYSTLDLDEIEGLHEIKADAYSYFNGQLHANRIWNGVVSGIGVTLIQPVYYSKMFNRDKVYGFQDDFERFAYFSRASLDYIAKSGKQPDVLHIHNWQTAIVGPLFWDVFVNQRLEGTRILLTCQEFDSKCLVSPEKLELCGLDSINLNRLDRLQDNTNPHFVNILKGGIVYSNKVVIMSSPHNSIPGLKQTLSIHKEKLLFAPSGLDSSTWDPQTQGQNMGSFGLYDIHVSAYTSIKNF